MTSMTRIAVACVVVIGLINALPVPKVPPGCRDHCRDYTKEAGNYNDCVGQCPTVADCMEAMSTADTVEENPEEYTDKIPGLPERPKLCTNHCWQSNVYAMHACMEDCPETWCRLYADITLPTTTTPTKPTTITTTMVPKADNGPRVQQVLDRSDEGGSISNKQDSNAIIGFSVLGVCVIIAGTIIGVTIYCKRRQHRNVIQSQSRGSSVHHVAETDNVEHSPPQGDVQQVPVGGFPATAGVLSDAHSTPIVTSASNHLPQPPMSE